MQNFQNSDIVYSQWISHSNFPQSGWLCVPRKYQHKKRLSVRGLRLSYSRSILGSFLTFIEKDSRTQLSDIVYYKVKVAVAVTLWIETNHIFYTSR